MSYPIRWDRLAPPMTLSPTPSLDLVLLLPMGLLLVAAALAIGTFVVWGRVRRP